MVRQLLTQTSEISETTQFESVAHVNQLKLFLFLKHCLINNLVSIYGSAIFLRIVHEWEMLHYFKKLFVL